jgi:hypothetical protein
MQGILCVFVCVHIMWWLFALWCVAGMKNSMDVGGRAQSIQEIARHRTHVNSDLICS